MCLLKCLLLLCAFRVVASQKTSLKNTNPFFPFRRYLDFPEGSNFIVSTVGSYIPKRLFKNPNEKMHATKLNSPFYEHRTGTDFDHPDWITSLPHPPVAENPTFSIISWCSFVLTAFPSRCRHVPVRIDFLSVLSNGK